MNTDPTSTRRACRPAPQPFDPEHHMHPAELAALRGPFVRRPRDAAPPLEWMRWAREVCDAAPDAWRLLDAAERKARGEEV